MCVYCTFYALFNAQPTFPPGLLSLLSRCNDLGHATDDAHALAAGLHGFRGGVAALTPETRELFHQMAGQSLVRSVPVLERTLKRGPRSWLVALL